MKLIQLAEEIFQKQQKLNEHGVYNGFNICWHFHSDELSLRAWEFGELENVQPMGFRIVDTSAVLLEQGDYTAEECEKIKKYVEGLEI